MSIAGSGGVKDSVMKPDRLGLDPYNIVNEADVIDVHYRQWWGKRLRDKTRTLGARHPHKIVSEVDVIDVHSRQWWGTRLRDEARPLGA